MTKRTTALTTKAAVATLIALAAAGLTGCASPKGVMPLSDGLNVVSTSGPVPWNNVTELQKEGARDATRFCSEQQRKVKVVDVKGFPAGMFSRSTRVETVFACEPAG